MPHNIVHIVCHDLGRALGCYGESDIASPALDAFARESVVFTNHFAASTPCSPSRGCIMTGRYAHCNGLIGLVNRGWDLPESERTIVDCLNDAGYHTANIGLQHERKNPAHNRYAYEWHETADAKAVAAEVSAYLEGAPKPFYLNAGTREVHLPFDRPEYSSPDPSAVRVPPFLPDTPEVRRAVAGFHGAIRYLDEAFATVVDAIDRTGRRDDTIVVFTTDHGMAFPRAKSTLYDPGVGTALMLRFPEGHSGAYDRLLSNIDLMPSLLEAVGIAPPQEVQGRSFYGLITGQPYAPHEVIFAEKNFHDHYDPVRAVRSKRFKYIRSFTDQPKIPLPTDIQRSIASKTLRPDANEPRPREELYDVAEDPTEEKNRIDDPDLAAVRAELRDRLDRWMTETEDPLLRTVELPYPPEQFR